MGAGTRTARSGLNGRMFRRCLHKQWDPEGQSQVRGRGPSVIQYVSPKQPSVNEAACSTPNKARGVGPGGAGRRRATAPATDTKTAGETAREPPGQPGRRRRPARRQARRPQKGQGAGQGREEGVEVLNKKPRVSGTYTMAGLRYLGARSLWYRFP